MQYSIDVRNAKLNAVVAAIGASPVLKILDGNMPSACSKPDNGAVLVEVRLPQPWMSSAVAGSTSLLGKWVSYSAARSGSPTYFRIYSMDGACKLQGAVGREMKISEDNLKAGQVFNVTEFTIRDANG